MKIKAFWLQPSPVLRDHSGDRQHTCWNIKYQNSKLQTHRFLLETQIFSLETPRFSSEIDSRFSLEIPDFHWRFQIFIGNPQIFIGYPKDFLWVLQKKSRSLIKSFWSPTKIRDLWWTSWGLLWNMWISYKTSMGSPIVLRCLWFFPSLIINSWLRFHSFAVVHLKLTRVF